MRPCTPVTLEKGCGWQSERIHLLEPKSYDVKFGYGAGKYTRRSAVAISQRTEASCIVSEYA